MCPGLYFRQHYFVVLLVPVSLLAGYFAIRSRLIVTRIWRLPVNAHCSLAVVIVVACAGLYSERDYLFVLSPSEVSHAIYRLNPFPESVVVGKYVHDHSSPGDTIAVVGSEPQIYFYAERLSATGHIYMYNLALNNQAAEALRSEFIDEIESQTPSFMVVVGYVRPGDGSDARLKSLRDWADKYLARNYRMVGLVDIASDATTYYWDGDAEGRVPRSEAFIKVWRRETADQ
jgi:hypothetical protein